MPTITVPHQFFIDERKKLYNWKPDFWRELVQNSVDAGSKNIQISLADCGGGQIQVTFADDGCGMTREVLDKVYFALGETTKRSGESVGGFGRARIMTCFGHDKYEIETLTNHVSGTGGEYMIDDIDHQYGCIVSVWMSDVTIQNMEEILKNYLMTCTLNVNISINGERFDSYLHRGRRVRELPFAGIYVNRNGTFRNVAIFRVNGMAMFHRYVKCGNKQIVVEIDPNRSREVLSANRNDFAGDFRTQIEQWIDEVTIDDTTALRDRNRETRKIIRGYGSLIMLPKRSQKEEDQRSGKAGSTAPIEVESTVPVGQRSAALANDEDIELYDRAPMTGDRFVRNLFDVVIIDETGDSSMGKIIERYDPQNWTYELKTERGETVPYRRGREAYRLLMTWKIAVEEALRVLVDEFDTGHISWSVGWVFGNSQNGCHIDIDNTHIFCLNPVEGTKSRYRLTSRKDLLVLLAVAKHEAAHARVDVHNETFANTLTRIDGAYDTQRVLRRIKTELGRLGV